MCDKVGHVAQTYFSLRGLLLIKDSQPLAIVVQEEKNVLVFDKKFQLFLLIMNILYLIIVLFFLI